MDCAISAVLLVVAICWNIVAFRLAPRLGLVRENFRGDMIIASYGIVSFSYAAAIAGAMALKGYVAWTPARLYLAVMGAMWVFGIIDDLFGSREVGGFAGHFKKLLRERRLTTGAVKAIGGGIVGVIAGWAVSGGAIAYWVSAAILIPLMANMLNLFDLRPGRAVAVFFLGLVVTYIAAGGHFSVPMMVAAIAAVTLVFGIADSRGKAMMGDSGSNMLGAALGLTVALNTNLAFQWALIALVSALHVYSEKHSVSELIERNRALRFVDRGLGVRE